jgi:hypothetical protein
VNALKQLIKGNMDGARSTIEAGIGASAPKYTSLLLDYALSESGIPLSGDVATEVALAAASGNASVVVGAVATAFGLPEWSQGALMALCGAAQVSSTQPGGLASMFTSSGASSVIGEVLSEYDVQTYMEAAELVDEYEASCCFKVA